MFLFVKNTKNSCNIANKGVLYIHKERGKHYENNCFKSKIKRKQRKHREVIQMKYSIKELRARNRMSGKELADAIGVNRDSIRRWENGYSKPSAENLIEMAKALHVSVEEIDIQEGKKCQMQKKFKP